MLNHLWQSTVFAAFAALLTLALRKNRAHVRYCVWLAASLKFLVPFSLLISLGTQLPWQALPIAAQTNFSVAIEQVSLPFSTEIPVIAVEPVAPRGSALPVLAFIWAFGTAAFAIRWWRQWRRMGHAVAEAERLPLSIGVEVRSSPLALEPGVFGILRPVLLLPEGLADRLTPEQLQSILTHEMCHVRRRDNLAAAVHMVVEALFWFHPLVWWLGARLVEERERACDEEVLRMGSDPQSYAESILKVCQLYLASPVACVAGVSGANLKQRIEEIMTRRAIQRLDLRKKLLLALAGCCAVAVPLAIGLWHAPPVRAQSSENSPKFEVASIRPCPEGRGDTKKGPPGGSPIVSVGRYSTGCVPLASEFPTAGLIQRVYGRLGLGHIVTPGSAMPLEGGPRWIYSQYYVINATAPGNPSRATMEGPMLQALLEDRFHLKVRRETRQVPVYDLTIAKGGFKLMPADEGACVQRDYNAPRQPPPDGKRYCQDMIGARLGLNARMNVEAATVDYFAKLLSLVVGRPVINRTGLTGRYNFRPEFAADQATPGVNQIPPGPSDEPPAPSIFTVLQQQYGLKLESAKGPRDFLVIEHIDRPTEN